MDTTIAGTLTFSEVVFLNKYNAQELSNMFHEDLEHIKHVEGILRKAVNDDTYSEEKFYDLCEICDSYFNLITI